MQMEETVGGETELAVRDELSSSHGHSAQQESEQLRATQLSSKSHIDLSPPLIAIRKETESKYHRHGGNLQTRNSELGSAATGSSLTTVLPSTVKKSKVLSSESREELAKQAKVTKEERRAQIDGRHRYLISRLADGIDLSEQQVEETIISDDKFQLIEQFFAPSGLKKLLFFYQDVLQQKLNASVRPDGSTNYLPQKNLFITMGSTEDITGTCAFFLRTSDEVITASNVSQEVNFGMFDCTNGNILQGLEFFLSQIMIPALKSQQNWGAVKEGLKNSQIQEFLYSVDKFVGTLSSSRQNIEDKIQLKKVDIDVYVKNLQNPSDYITAGTNREVTEKLEEVVTIWTKQIRQVLVESEQIRREADDVGPSAELEHWKSRMSSFNSLLDEIKSSRVKKIISILQAARSKTLQQWKELDRSITIAANEAKDNVRYLYTLDKFFGPLAHASPVKVMEHIPSLMNTVFMIYCTSPYYNTSEHMTSLFLKITNQMINTCKTYLCEGVSKIWDLDRQELLKRIQQCIFLKEKYQASFQKIREELKEYPSDRQFDVSENYIFGKFETFCKRLEKISDMSNTMESLLELQRIRIEGIDKITAQYQSIATNAKSKQYDVLDHRKKEFEKDYLEFKNKIAALYESIQEFVDSWFKKTLTTEQMLGFLMKLEIIGENNIDLNEKYTIVLQQYSQDLEFIQKLYQKEKENPPIPRNIPPVTGKIMWAQQLFRKIYHPMMFLKKKTTLLKTVEMKKVIKNYNKMAAVLLEFEIIYHRAWYRFADQARNALCASLLVRHPETKELFVNLDPMVLEVLYETKYLRKMHFEVPDVVLGLCADEEQIKRHQRELQNLLIIYKEHLNRIPVVLKPLMKPWIGQIEDAFTPGLMQLSWTSLNINKFIQNVYSTLRELDYVVKAASDTLECRIERILKDMSNTALIVLPEDEPADVTSFLEQIEKLAASTAPKLSQQSQQVECSAYELIDILKHSLKADAGTTLEDSFACTHLDMKQKTRCQECVSCSYYNLMGQLCQKNTDSLIRCTKISLESLRHRLHVIDSRYQTTKFAEAHRVPLLRTEIHLAIPNIVLRPSLEDIQSAVNKAVNIILSVAKDIPLWKFAYLHHKQQQVEQAVALESGDESKLTRMVALKPLDKQIVEHKDVNKVVIQLSTIILALKTEALVLLKTFSEFSDIWNKDPEEKVKEFIDTKPTMAEFQSQIRYFSQLEMQIRELPNHCALQSLEVATESLKIALIQECRSGQRTFGLALNKKSATDVGEIYSFIENVSKRLSRPIQDLDDVREAMEALREIRENEIKIDMTVGHIEESYSVLHKYNLLFQDENTERGDGLAYAWKNLNTQAQQVEDLLLKVQPVMKTDLLRDVQKFQIGTAGFYKEYDEKGPSEDNIPPHEASDRLQIFQAKFDQLWRKYLSLSSGEELFGLPITEYPELHRIKRELTLLQKLYSLYDTVTSSTDRYNEMLWNDLNIEKLNSELLEFQSKIRKLPKALKEWQAFQDLKKKIDDFTESCPLLEMMKNKAMLSRHWEKIAQVTGHHFDVDSENFTLKNVMDAPLLKHKEDIEDICISAVKEKEIEAKLKHIISEWSTHTFSFGQFKSRGELLLKGSDISEKIALVEDSLMMLGSLMSNRYNAPFKSTIQQWVQKLTNTAEIIENWITVQNLWIYLEAVFVGGDIAKQLPQVMHTTNQKFLELLNDLIDMATHNLTRMERTKYETLITIHVHQKDIFDDLVRMNIKSPFDFEWQKQSRFYFLEDLDKCIIKITDVEFTYCNEYLGCTDRLVITPLTDRCYITLAQALGMSMGGAPAGPAGTGKTETTKDMGKCLGKYVVVFNCSDQMDYRGLGRIYKGLAQSGAWGCFDEFNRIELPVLSVAAQQIYIVLQCKKKKKLKFTFTDGDVVDMDREFGIFLTMNPGYAGRQELPENLKIQFRTVAMMVPDRSIIMRVKLASAGFRDNQILSQKFYTLYKLCEEQLSKQVHYDFGLRNILSVLRTLGAVKRSNPQEPEKTVVMRVLRDMNLSKLVDEDEPLFMSLINDLFPGITLDKSGYPELQSAIQKQTEEAGLINHPPWILKLIQLYETQRVRHGMMTLGPTGTGKTKCIHILMKAMTDCGAPHKEMRMNPKAITASQMFGTLDVATNDWTDGIFSTLWRKTLKAKKGEHIWIVLDGPVDAIWIENLNSVLDDNKTLTLANGDRIPMSPNCKIIFEPHNIDNASPATVSRNGMVFMSSSVLDWKPILRAWLQTLPITYSNVLWNCFNAVFQDVMDFVFSAVTPKMSILECMYIKQAIDLLQGLLSGRDEKQLSEEHIARLFVFAVMWSAGALLEPDDKLKMELFLRKHSAVKELPAVNGEETMFEFVINACGQWEHWSKKVPEYIYPKDSVPEYTSILVPNTDSVRTDFLMHTIMRQGKAVLLIGEQGTAKTVMIKNYTSKYDPDVHLTKCLNFSSATLPHMFQRNIESYIGKRMGATHGPPAGKKMTVFIDDINMPLINEWGDQITNEIVRQLMEQKGFYSLEKPGEFMNVVDIQFVAAMIHPGGGRNDIPQRLKRQFSIFNCTLPSTSSIDKIFQTIAEGYFCEQRHFPTEVCKLASALVSTSRKVWQMTKAKMLPTPAKFHYIFNLRDLSRIWQGILTVTSDVCQSISVLVALFQHECRRVIADRFISQSDKDWFEDMMRKIVSEEHGQDVFGDKCTELYFVDFLRDVPETAGDEPDDAELKAPKIYEPIPSLDYLAERLQMFMQQYNETVRGSKMDLVFFKDAIVHLIKISRIIRTPQGNALLVGVGGSGKQSLTRLAAYIAGHESFQITLTRTYSTNNLLDDLKMLYRTAGQIGKGVVFIFTDNEVRDESFLEYMNNVLASGEVSNLFARDEISEITEDLIPAMKKEYPRLSPTGENLYNYFLSRVRNNLHVVLCFSPVGEKFRTHALKFPGLISGCTIDWFQHWPKDALIAVAQHFLASYHIECTDEVKQSVFNTMGTIQDIVAEKCIEYFERYRRRTFVTPKSYLSFIGGYKTVYQEKFASLGSLSERMRTGLAKLMEAEVSVNQLSKELVMKEKDLAIASKKADEVLLEVTMKAHAAEKVKTQVQTVKDKAQAIVDDIAIDKAAAEEKLEAARPALEEAKAALQTIKPSDIATVRKLGKPPHLIMRIMDCVLLLFQRKIDSVTLDHEHPGVKPSWTEAQKLMNNSGFLSMLLTFQKDSITEETVELLEPYLDMEDYNLDTAKKVCGNVAGLCSWTQAMVYFYSINKEVLPLKANLALQEGRLATAEMELNNAQNQLDEKQAELDEVQAMYDAAVREKQALLDDAEGCRRKMNNASALIEGLGGEKLRWTASSKNFQNQIINLVGNVLLATGFLSYSGPFNQEYRNLLLQLWRKEMDNSKIPYSKNLNLTGMLVDNATVGEWNLQGLPNDDLSIQNGIIVTKASRYPLLIDPQGQGKIWIKNKEKNNGLQVTAMNHKFFRSHIEDCLSLGRPLLIEDIGEELDPALDNILEKNFIKFGSAHKVKVGDKEVDLTKGFTLYMTTKVANPVYTPEISARTTVIDFTVTMKGLEDQLLGRVILTEKQELEAERIKLMEQVTSNKRKMQELEDNLLCRLTSTEGSLVEDESLIEVLRITKSTAEEVSEKLNTAMETEVKINTAREEYRPVAGRGSILYFLIVEMSLVNVMYQTSLGQFLGIFDLSVERSRKSQIPAKRVVYIIEHLTYEVFKYTVRGLYENDRFLFTLLLALKIDLQAKKISHTEFETLIKGGASLDMNSVEPKPKKWILDTTWLNLVQLSSLYPFDQLLVQIVKNEKSWKAWFDEEAPEKSVIPDGYDSLLDQFHKLLLVRSWCPDHTVAQARHYIAESLGEKYAEGFILEMEEMWTESGCRTPLTCLLSVGSDPTENIERLAKSKNIPCRAISMGQGQEVHARHLLNQCMQDGGWLLLQNCHLGLEFLNELMDTITTKESVNEDFRTWITTEAHPEFPINLLQSSIKFINEPPQGVKAGLKRTYSAVTQDLLGASKMPQWKPLLYAIAFLHTTVQERRKFGPLGWNIPYEFNQADFSASVQFLQNHLNDVGIRQGVNWSCVRYMLGEVQYGGRVTDDLDKALLNTYARVWFGEHMFTEKFCFYKGYVIPKGNTVEDYLQYIEQLPVTDTPEVFGLHPNADITYQTNLANETFSTIVSIQPKDSSTRGGETREAVVQRLADEMLEKLPPDYNPHEVKAQLQKMGAFQPMNIFLRQEIDRMQLVICRVRATLTDLKLAIDGTIIMSEELQDALDNIYDTRIPKLWFRISWESSTLGFWFTELLERNQQFSSWLQDGRPNQFWMTGFFNPQGFLTAMRQETTRMNVAKGWELDSVVLCSEVTKMMKEDVVGPPPADLGGVYIHGLFLEGAGWDRRNSKLIESAPKVLFTSLPVVHVYAVSTTAPSDARRQHGNVYCCPVYRKPRRTDLTYIFSLHLRTVQNPDHWTLRGVALLCSSK
nr:dynein heavy chain 5, axonemal isoform X3 [Zonotrichia albicollis]